MAALNVEAACISLEIDASLDDLAIIFPGGAILEIPSPPNVDVAFALDYTKQILAAASAALMPLQPIFNIIDLILLIVEFCKAVPDAISHLDPGKLFKLIPKIGVKVGRVLALVPPLSIPIFLKSLIRVIVVMLKGLQAALNVIIDAVIEAALPAARADIVAEFSLEASIQLRAAADCAKATADVSMAGLAQGLKPLDSLLKIIKLFVDMIGLPVKVPTLQTLGADAKVAVDIIGTLITALEIIGFAIPG